MGSEELHLSRLKNSLRFKNSLLPAGQKVRVQPLMIWLVGAEEN